MKHSAEYQTFTNAIERIMSVPKEEILRREAGDTYLIGSGLVSAFHFGINRSNGVKSAGYFYSWRDLGTDAATFLSYIHVTFERSNL